jgi:hypothetical protein
VTIVVIPSQGTTEWEQATQLGEGETMNMKKMPAIIQDSIDAGPMVPEAPNTANNQPLPSIPVRGSMK